ncbi:MAG: hypothetical protein LUE29_09440 [Lachnospiraceae bacterium]|nr:hypothetical protein [Lachnospiraceae bacterium]
MPIKEKKLRSPRYLWKILICALDIAFLILALSVAVDLYRVADPETGAAYVMLATGERMSTDGDNVVLQFAKLIAALCMVAYVGLLLTLSRVFSNELFTRENAERLQYAMGYRKMDIVIYEEIYVMFDLLLAYLAAVLFAAGIGALAGRVNEIALLNRTLSQNSCIVSGAYPATGIVAAAVIAAGTARQAASQWSENAKRK